jgi:hypothetical protein
MSCTVPPVLVPGYVLGLALALLESCGRAQPPSRSFPREMFCSAQHLHLTLPHLRVAGLLPVALENCSWSLLGIP